MTYLVEINDKTNNGLKALHYLRKLQHVEPGIRIISKKAGIKKLTAKDMVLPGGAKPTTEQLEEFFDREDAGKSYTLAGARKKLERRYKGKK